MTSISEEPLEPPAAYDEEIKRDEGSSLFEMEDNKAPVDFHVMESDSSDDENFHQLLSSQASSSPTAVEKVVCPLCFRKRPLTCKECLLQGNFCVQNKNNKANAQLLNINYGHMKQKFLRTQGQRTKLFDQCANFTDRKGKISRIVEEIEKCQNTIATQKELKRSLMSRIQNANLDCERLRRQTEENFKNWPVYRSRLDNMHSQYGKKVSNGKTFHEVVQKQQDNLKLETKRRIVQLMDHIFPITEINPAMKTSISRNEFNMTASVESWEDEEDETVRSLMAAKSNYWGKSDELATSFGLSYGITGKLGPSLPASGDYSAYGLWTERGSAGLSGGSSSRNPAHSITAALTYTTQFVNLIAYYLDLRLPHRLSYSEFTNEDLLAGKFNRKVAKLNANVIHLCSSQGIPPSFLQPRTTLSNILLLFNPASADLGRRGPFEVASQLAKSMEDSIEKDLVIYEEGSSESDTEWSDSTFPSDWETINRGAVEEFGLQEMTSQSYLNNLSPSPSYTGDSFYRSRNAGVGGTGLFSSVTSFFRGWK